MKKSPQPSRFPAWRRFGLSILAVLGLVTGGSSAGLSAASGVWEPVAQDALGRAPDQTVVEQRYRVFRLNQDSLLEILQRAPMESTETAAREGAPVVLELPLPDGTLSRFRVEESPIMEPALQAQFPEIRTYHGQGIDDPTALTRFDFTPAGFHAIVFTTRGTIYVDPHTKGDPSHYVTYNKRDYRREGAEPFRCLVHGRSGVGADRPVVGDAAAPLDTPFGTTRRTYLAAVAATGEYTAFHGGTVPLAMNAITTTMNRVTGIYERELAVRMTLVGNNSSIVYTNSATDPYTNSDPNALLTQNQSNLDTIIGSASYDIGHVFSTGGGGLAALGVVCAAGAKAQGETGSSAPIGDAFDVDYVAHEMGHQFDGNHTFNGTTSNCGGGNRNASTAFEPGSGSTIMAYAGICGAEDLQPNSDDIFHAGSLDEIRTFVSATACDDEAATSNTPPTANAGADFTIPRSTPFTLTGSATDANGDTLTYAWEEMDLGTASPPNTDSGNRPIFRSFDPTTSPSRTFPRLANILNNTTTLGESLPTTTRSMNFRLTVRDNRAGGGGTNFDQMLLNVRTDSGPFTVTAPNTAISWAGGSTQTVTWNVANTNLAPVSTANVKVSLSTDGGNTFPTVLLASTPNDGSQTITVPNLASTTARVKVEAVGNVYFDISNVNFTITAGGATPTVTPSTTTATPGQAITVAVAGGPGAVGDWVGLYAVGAAQNAYLSWKYMNNTQTAPATGLTAATLNFTMPTPNGNYEFRLISVGTLRATSATVVVSGTSTTTVTPSTTTATPGQAITVAVAGGPGAVGDWVGLFQVGAAQSAYLSWKYMNNTQTAPSTGLTAATLNFTMPTPNGNYEFRLISAGTLRATSATVVVSGGSSPTVTPSTTTATPSQPITVAVAGGPGAVGDWVGLFPVGAANTGYLSWKYMNNLQTPPAAGISAATLNFTMPAANGNYHFRLFSASTVRATSATVVVQGAGGTDSDGDRLPDSAETNTGVYVNTSNTGTNPNNADTDGDGIKDGDEVLGTLAGLNLPAMGANPLKKDLFLEYDWFDDNLDPGQCGAHSHRPTQAMVNKVTAAFAAAPNVNPDGSTGVVIHHDFGQGGAFTGGNLAADADGVLAGGVNDAEFQARKTANFASNRNGYFHYVLMPHRYNTTSGSSGQAELPGDDLIVSLQCFNSLDNVANTIMHELGHNLDLEHGGFESCNWKPNYNSVMNYRFQFPGVDTSCNALGNNGEANVLDYSRGTRIALNENSLNENSGSCGSTAIDWNFSSSITTGVVYDLNRTSEAPNASTGVDNSFCTAAMMTLQDSNDWTAASYAGLTDADRGVAPRRIVECDNPAPETLPESE